MLYTNKYLDKVVFIHLHKPVYSFFIHSTRIPIKKIKKKDCNTQLKYKVIKKTYLPYI